MKNRILILSILLISFGTILTSCECPSEIDTPKEIVPKDFANVTIINALPEFQDISVMNNVNYVLPNLNYFSNFINTSKFIAGYSNISIKNSIDSTTIYNSFFNFDKDSNYTMVIYGKSNRNYSLLIKDKALNNSLNKAFIRFIHASLDAPKNVKFVLSQNFNLEFLINAKSNSEYFETEPTTYDLKILNSVNDSILINYGNIKLESQNAYTLLLKGYQSTNDTKKLMCQVIKKKLL